MKRATLVLWCLLAADCTRQPAPAPPKAEPAPAASREVVLDAAAQKQAGVVVETIADRSLPRVLRATARVALNENRTWRVGAVTEGRIVRVLANAGDQVTQGQILARMHSHIIHESRAEYGKAVAELARAKAAAAAALRQRDRAKTLLDLKAGSVEQVEHAETELRNAQAAVGSATIEVDRTRRHLVEFLEIPADHPEHPPGALNEEDHDLIPIKSPATGTLLARNITPGMVVQPSGDLFVVTDLATLWTIASVSEEHLTSLRPGMPARTYVQAYPNRPFSGKIGNLGEELDPTTRTVRVRIDTPNLDGRLKPEMYATAEIDLGGSDSALFVPQEAFQEISGETVVFVRRAPDRFEATSVRLGRTVGNSQEVIRGLKPGDVVVTRGSFALKSVLLKASLGED
jgi:multidrug efflux pump subunit AcrA (membrane-fusion protein)